MFPHYLKSAIRNIGKYKVITLINIFGLSVGMAVSIIMLMYVVNETSYEKCHSNKDRIYLATYEFKDMNWKWASTPYITGSVLREEIPEIEKAVRMRKFYNPATIKVDENNLYSENKIIYTEPDIFDIFSYNLIRGRKESVLKEPFSVVLTRSIAEKYFNNSDPIGRTLIIDDDLYKINGIMDNIPLNTHFNSEILISYSTCESKNKINKTTWNGDIEDITCFLIKEGSRSENVIAKLNGIKSRNSSIDYDNTYFSAYNIQDIHWINELSFTFDLLGNKVYVFAFLLVAILILLIACFNFINLSSSNFMERLKEIGVRKIIGAGKNQIIYQFLIQSMIVIAISSFFGICLFELLVEKIFSFLGSQYVLVTSSSSLNLLLITLSIIIVMGICSAVYPVFFISKFRPVDIIRKNMSGSPKRLSFRKIVVTFQYMVTIFLMIGITVIYSQLDYMKNSDLGFQKQNVITMDINFSELSRKYKNQDLGNRLKSTYSVFCNELKKSPNISGVAITNTYPGPRGLSINYARSDNQVPGTKVQISQIWSDYDYASILGLQLLKGRFFSKEISEDTSSNIIINETAAKELNLKEAIGEDVIYENDGTLERYKVIGVVKDFHFRAKHEKIMPLSMYCNTRFSLRIIVKYFSKEAPSIISEIYSTWNKIEPGVTVNLRELENGLNKMYETEERLGRFLAGFGILAIIISSLGLLGLTMFVIIKRTKEVGIRKVLGATTTNLLFLLSGQFLKWVVWAALLACPAAYYVFNKWLEDFAYKINFGIEYYLFSISMAILIAFATVSSRSIITARSNPVDSLRNE